MQAEQSFGERRGAHNAISIRLLLVDPAIGYFLLLLPDFCADDFLLADFDPPARFGRLLRFVCASSSSSFLLIEPAMLLDAPRNFVVGISPRFAASAAPAAICCFFDFAGILQLRTR